ncbi:MAG: ATP phosphoribosyltransferase [Deltaproteobacteria bacterium]|nr:MAG: ATP phosphoribosyltransferase [Deltaproteobacteria bacterium]
MMESKEAVLRLALPKGSIEKGVLQLLEDAGISVRCSSRGYRPQLSLPGCEAKLLRPPNIVEMLQAGSRDVGFTGADWVAELGAELEELLDCELDPVRIVAAAPAGLVESGEILNRPIVVATEYINLTRRWIEKRGIRATVIRSYGATEVFPPEDADCIVDNTATGSTLRANGLVEFDQLMASTTRLYASPAALGDPSKRAAIDRLVLLLGSVLESRRRVMVEVNVPAKKLEGIISILPCMRQPTVAPLAGGEGYAVKAAVPRGELVRLIPLVKDMGGQDIVVSNLAQLVP